MHDLEVQLWIQMQAERKAALRVLAEGDLSNPLADGEHSEAELLGLHAPPADARWQTTPVPDVWKRRFYRRCSTRWRFTVSSLIAELFGDIPVAATFDDAADDFQFAGRKPVGFALGNGCLLHELVQCAYQVHDTFSAYPIISQRIQPGWLS